MFDIGFFELLLIGIVGLLVLGPERLPRAARTAGLWVRRARATWYSVRSELERELAEADLKKNLENQANELKELGQTIDKEGKSLAQSIRHEEATAASSAASNDADAKALAGDDVSEQDEKAMTEPMPGAEHEHAESVDAVAKLSRSSSEEPARQ